MKKYLLLALALVTQSVLAADPISPSAVRYNGFDVVLDCNSKLPVYVYYRAQRDTGNEERSSSFYLDPNVAENCQQTSTDSYKMPYKIHAQYNRKMSYDRGHLVPANHMDGNKESIKQTNYMTNIVPMTKTVNRTGAWRYTEKLTECTRDLKEFDVHAGVVIGTNNDDDYFISSHGIPTPDYLWKVLFDGENIISWIIPNAHNAVKENLSQYKASVTEIEEMTGLKLPIPAHYKAFVDQSEWNMPERCDWR